MKVAIPIFEGDIAPRFGFTSMFLIAEVIDQQVKSRIIVRVEHQDFFRKLEALQHRDIDTILCGGFNRRYLPAAQDMGLNVLDGLCGDGETVLQAYARGAPLSPKHKRRCCRRHRPDSPR